jgi:predicted ArsR family transcriptional regulator
MAWWQRQSGKTTRNRVISLLRRGARSVEELAGSLGLTDNAVRAQLASLQREGVVRAVGIRRDGAVGKPATLYAIAADSSAIFSSAYAPVLTALLAELKRKMTSRQVASLMRRAGRRLARTLPERATFDERVKAGAGFLAAMGADADLVQTGAGYEIRGHGCLLSDAVVECPATCAVVEQLLREVTGGSVVERCDRADQPSCRFSITPATAR